MTIFFDRLSKKGKMCVATCPQVERELIKDYGVRSTVVSCGIDTKHFSRRSSTGQIRLRYGIEPQSIVCVFIGRWDIAQKGLDLLITIMRERQDVHWLIATDRQINIKGIRNLTILLDVPYEELPNVYSAADFSIQLSRYESFGFSFVESLSCSVPVISTPVGIASYLYDDPLLSELALYGNGYQAEKIIADVHKKIEKLKDRHYLEALAARCRERVEKEFSLKAWKENMRHALQSLLEVSPCK
jgi:glycosyltransferase involved in cell wall biosynthesis